MNWLVLALLSGSLATTTSPRAGDPAEAGVFLRLLDAPAGSFSRVSDAVGSALSSGGFRVLAIRAVETGCDYRAAVFVVATPGFAEAALEPGWRGAFLLPVRLALYEDEGGVHLALANPLSLGRTIVSDQFVAPAETLVSGLTRALGSVPGTAVREDYGQLRTRGLIEKTMGIVAGGPFPDKVERLASEPAHPGYGPAEVAAALAQVARRPSRRWGLQVAYRYPLADGSIVVGLTGGKMEAKALAIVGAGGDDARKDFACPGVDHAAAFPLELLVRQDGDRIEISAIDVMYRMKLYFEDAGRMKFAANMAMPGSIENEIRDLVEAALELDTDL